MAAGSRSALSLQLLPVSMSEIASFFTRRRQSSSISACVAGHGALGQKHLDAIKIIGGHEVVSLVGRDLDNTKAAAEKYKIGHATTDLAEALAQPGVDAAILCTPTQMHAAQAIQIVRRRKPLGSRKWSTETVYAVTSLTAAQARPDQLAAALRGHWAIEDRLHWVRDVTYGDDLAQVHALGAELHLSRFDLGQIEHVVHQSE